MDVAVLDPLPLFRHGVVAALGRGTTLGSAAELRSWLKTGVGGILLLTLDDDDSWTCLADSQARPGVATVAVLPTFTVTDAANALRAGAVHVIARQADSARLTRVVDEVATGSVTLPVEILRATFVLKPEGRRPRPADEELTWLRALAAGHTITRLAADHHHSERALYRRLRVLYHRLGVRGRTEALMLARDEGWL